MTPRPPEPAPDPIVARAAARLREPVPVRDPWRAALLGEIARDEVAAPAARSPRGIVLRPGIAVAASLLLVAGGAVLGALAARRESAPIAAAARALEDRSAVIAPAAASREATARFVVVAPGARRVAIVGDFNLWNAEATPMRPTGDGRTWLVELPLRAGRHAYAFVVDGAVAVDPAAPRAAEDDFGRPNSVIVVAHPAG